MEIDAQTEERLIKEEQNIVNELIRFLEKKITICNESIRNILAATKRAAAMGPDAYGELVDQQNRKRDQREKREELYAVEDELYVERIRLTGKEQDGTISYDEFKIGYHGLSNDGKGNIVIMKWSNPIAQHFIGDNYMDDYVAEVNSKGEKIYTEYSLDFRRRVDMRFSKVRNVIHLFPLTIEEAEQLLYDDFLRELSSRKGDSEFRDIVFSIQKRQSEIIRLPIRENLIVQGCAGSGKSMIMLHRLPVLLDNPQNSFDRNSIFIISPSDNYIQQVDRMMIQLEIGDLKIGTLNQYYDYILEKYNLKADVYGHISYRKKLTKAQIEYVYGKECIEDIRKMIDEQINAQQFDAESCLEILGISSRTDDGQGATPALLIRNKSILINSILTANEKVLRNYYNEIRSALSVLRDICNMLSGRQTAIIRAINQAIIEENNYIEDEKKKREKRGKSVSKEILDVSAKKIEKYLADKTEVENDVEYFQALLAIKDGIEEGLADFSGFKRIYEQNQDKDIYFYIENRPVINACFDKARDELWDLSEKYSEYTATVSETLENNIPVITKMRYYREKHLDLEHYTAAKESNAYYSKLAGNLPYDVYLYVMEKLDSVPDKKGNMEALSCSPYIYTQIMYLFSGIPNAAPDRLITLDEAQGIAPEELQLIKNLNGKGLILNLFGDVNQHIEGTKGIDSWSEFSDVISVEPKRLDENYRNSRQVTEYCNRRFSMHMLPVNLDGDGVHIIGSFDQFKHDMRDIFVNTQKGGLKAIIVEDEREAFYIETLFPAFKDKIQNMSGTPYDLHRTKWNLLTVEQAKGLEFQCVVAVTGNMTTNEKYISYTRALDNLYVFDTAFEVPSANLENKPKDVLVEKKNEPALKKGAKPKRKGGKTTIQVVDYSKSEVAAYFREIGLEVKDMRPKGYLWVIGDRDKIEDSINEAVTRFGISCNYAPNAKQIGFRNGFYFNTKR